MIKIKKNRIKPYCIVLTTIFACWLLNYYSPVKAQILNDYEQQMIQVSNSNSGSGITSIIDTVFDALRLYWFMAGILIFYMSLKTSFSQGLNNISQLSIFLSLKFFAALTIINFAYALIRPIIVQGI